MQARGYSDPDPDLGAHADAWIHPHVDADSDRNSDALRAEFRSGLRADSSPYASDQHRDADARRDAGGNAWRDAEFCAAAIAKRAAVTDAYANTDIHSCANAVDSADSNRHIGADSYAEPDASADANLNADINSDRDAMRTWFGCGLRPDADRCSRADRVTYADTDPLANADANRDTKADADTDCDADTLRA